MPAQVFPSPQYNIYRQIHGNISYLDTHNLAMWAAEVEHNRKCAAISPRFGVKWDRNAKVQPVGINTHKHY